MFICRKKSQPAMNELVCEIKPTTLVAYSSLLVISLIVLSCASLPANAQNVNSSSAKNLSTSPTKDPASLELLERASIALGEGWARIRAVRMQVSVTDSGGTRDFTWTNGWTSDNKLSNETRKFNGDKLSLVRQSSTTSTTTPRPVPNPLTALLPHAPGEAIYMALYDARYQVTPPIAGSGLIGECVHITTPQLGLWEGGVFAFVCFSKETGLPESAKIAMPQKKSTRPMLFRELKFENYSSQQGLIGPSMVTITLPGQQRSHLSIRNIEFGTSSQDFIQGER